MNPGPSLHEAVARGALSPETDAVLAAAMSRLRAVAGPALDGCLFFGSRRTNAARANAWSAYDLFVVVADERAFYEALRGAGLTGKSPRLLAAVGRVLPPTQVSVVFREPELLAKVSVIRRDVLDRETSPRRHDHFTIGRLFQPTRILATASDEARERLLAAVVSAHRETWRWSRPWLPPSFTAAEYGERVLEISMSWEIRPEPHGRAAALWEAQRDAQEPVFDALLSELELAGELERLPARPGDRLTPHARSRSASDEAAGDSAKTVSAWRIVHSPGILETLRLRSYFIRSMARATARWGKHILSFEGWLDYIVRKVSRHSGDTIVLTDRERRWPLVFLWGRVFRYLRDKNRKDVRS